MLALSCSGNNGIGGSGRGGSGGDATGAGGVATGGHSAGGVSGTAGAGDGTSTGGVGDGGVTGTGGSPGSAGTGGATAPGPWVMGYWAVWQTTQYPLARVAWSDMTHAAISFVEPRAPAATSSASPYATLDSSNAVDNLGATGMADFAAAARNGGAHPIISLGGAGAGAGFAAAASPANQKQFVSDVLAACARWHYDGVDLDWEDGINLADFQSLVLALRAGAPPGFLITAPVGAVNNNAGIDAGTAGLWSAVAGAVDQINVMTYTGSGNYPGWVVWYLDPLMGAGSDHPFDVASSLAAWAALGIPRSKLGVGIGFYGRAVSAPVTAALQSYGSATVYEDDTELSYGNIQRYFVGQGGAVSHWDATAMTTWLSWATSFHPSWTDQFPGDQGPATQFLTFEDVPTVMAKGAWLKSNGYGGVIIWTINEGTQYPYGGDGYANPLLDATTAAFR
jgi:chitinase